MAAARSVNVLITGANRGLGLEMVGQMVKGSVPVRKLIACCRDPLGPRSEVSSRAPSVALFQPSVGVCSSALCLQALQTLAKQHPDSIFIVRLGKG